MQKTNIIETTNRITTRATASTSRRRALRHFLAKMQARSPSPRRLLKPQHQPKQNPRKEISLSDFRNIPDGVI